MLLALVYPILLGLDRLETAAFLRRNGTFQYLTGLPGYPDAQTLRRFSLHAPPELREQLHRLNDRLLRRFIHQPEPRTRLILDLDSTVVTVFGRQEGTAVGYNPRYRGKRSYDPLLCLEATRRRLSFFVMVLCHSRLMYVEFTLSEGMEQFLTCHRHALEFFGSVPSKVMIDNLKVGVLQHPLGQSAQFNPRYLDFAAHYGFQPLACTVKRANEKGRVENGVGYVKKDFLHGLEIPSIAAVNPAARQWLDTVANVRLHGETRRKPLEHFVEEKPHLKPLALIPYDCAVIRPSGASGCCRVVLDTSRSRSQKGILVFLARDATERVLCYANIGLTKAEQPSEVLRFVECWKTRTGKVPAELVFDSHLTTYARLHQLNQQGIRFMTLRRRSKKMLGEIYSRPASAWRRIHLPSLTRSFRTPRVLDEPIALKA
jgi:hypothetical protein